jgi:hypothetical protein
VGGLLDLEADELLAFETVDAIDVFVEVEMCTNVELELVTIAVLSM